MQEALKKRRHNNVFHEHSHSRASGYLKLRKKGTVVITGVREPAGQSVSSFFYNLTKKKSYWYVGSKKYIRNLDIKTLIEIFKTRLPYHLDYTYRKWFEYYEKTTGVDIKNLNETAWGWEIYKGDCSFIFYRMEELKTFLVSAPLGGKAPEPDLIKNSARDIWYSAMYLDFKRRLVFSKAEYKSLFRGYKATDLFYDDDLAQNLMKEYIV